MWKTFDMTKKQEELNLAEYKWVNKIIGNYSIHSLKDN